MSKLLQLILVLFVLVFVFSSCKRNDFDPYFGEQACPDEGFEILTPFEMSTADSVVDFENGDYIHFFAEFSEKASWLIEIKGKTSNASVIIEGNSVSIDTNWYGTSNSTVFFVGEEIEVTFDVVCRPDLKSEETISISQPDFSSIPWISLVTGFDGGGVPLSNIVFYEDKDAALGLQGVADTTHCNGAGCGVSASPHGGKFVRFTGTSPIPDGENKNVYGTFEIYGEPGQFPALPTNPDDVYFNALVNTEGAPAKIVVSLVGGFDQTKKTLEVQTDDWEWVSFSLSDMNIDVPSVGDPSRLSYFLITVVQSKGISPTVVDLDLICFSSYGSVTGE